MCKLLTGINNCIISANFANDNRSANANDYRIKNRGIGL